MRCIKPFIAIAVLSWFITGCVSSQKVDRIQANDRALPCQDLLTQIEEADTFKKKAEDNKGVNKDNVVAGVFFFPALISTYIDANDAIKAAEDRKMHLVQIYNEKKCATKGKK